jgi:hypothetical protein
MFAPLTDIETLAAYSGATSKPIRLDEPSE